MRSFTGGPTLTTEYTYDANGNVESMTYPDERVATYAYDDADRVSRVTSVKLGTVKIHADNITHMPFGGVSSYTYGNGLTAVRTYDLDGRLRFLKSGPMVRREYGYDSNGNITSISDLVNAAKSQSFTYDALDRLRTALGAYGAKTYSYDAAGNRIGDGVNELVYDENGNVEMDGILEYEYEAGAPVPGVETPFIQTSGLYSYAGANPVNFTDPTGEFIPVVIGGVIIGADAVATGALITGIAIWTGASNYYLKYGNPLFPLPYKRPCRSKKENGKYCEGIYENDRNICNTLTTPKAKALCFGKAAIRLANCLRTGEPYPDLFPKRRK